MRPTPTRVTASSSAQARDLLAHFDERIEEVARGERHSEEVGGGQRPGDRALQQDVDRAPGVGCVGQPRKQPPVESHGQRDGNRRGEQDRRQDASKATGRKQGGRGHDAPPATTAKACCPAKVPVGRSLREAERDPRCRRYTTAKATSSHSGTNANDRVPSTISRSVNRPDARSDTPHPSVNASNSGRRSSVTVTALMRSPAGVTVATDSMLIDARRSEELELSYPS